MQLLKVIIVFIIVYLFIYFRKNKKAQNNTSQSNACNENINLQNSTPDKMPQNDAEVYTASELGQLRYAFEHICMRDNFFNDPNLFLKAIMTKDGVYKVFDFFSKQNNVPNPYSKYDFKTNHINFDGDNLIVGVDLPAPEYVPLCYRVYFVADFERQKAAYYTIEKSFDCGFLCQWDGDRHIDIHKVDKPLWEKHMEGAMKGLEFFMIENLYKEFVKIS